jgi:N-acetylmuramoyl-L-alanine amidase
MKKLIAGLALGVSLLITTPTFAYEVQSGDTMKKIATKHSMTLQELKGLNPQVKNIDLIYVGQDIKTSAGGSKVVSPSITEQEKDLLARLVRAEAQGEPYAGQVAVAVVVLNRVDSGYFPNTITGVINQKGQFTPVSNGEINKAADSSSKRAVAEALRTDRSKGKGSMYFYNSATATNRWLDSRPTTLVIGNHTFKK